MQMTIDTQPPSARGANGTRDEAVATNANDFVIETRGLVKRFSKQIVAVDGLI